MGGAGGDEKGNCNQAWVKSIKFTDTSELILVGTQANIPLRQKSQSHYSFSMGYVSAAPEVLNVQAFH